MSNKLDQIQIPLPCLKDWDQMVGDDCVRYCAECKKNVYNISKMTRREAEALIATKRGSLCARMVLNPDGTILTRPLPAASAAASRRASPVAAAVVTAILGISPNTAAHTNSMMHNPTSGHALQSMVAVVQGEIISKRLIPLRELYERSDLVVVARAGESVKVSAEGSARMMKTRLQITSTHKGAEHPTAVDLYHWDYGQDGDTYSKGGELLLFLNREPFSQAGSNRGYTLVDSIAGVKELPEADLQVYLQRIDELAAMTSKGSPDRGEIVEWLLRCVEHKATMLDGVSDLEQRANELAEEEPGVKLFEKLLTAEQRERLTQALFTIETVAEDDLRLVRLVRRWDDGRLTAFLLAQLRRMESDPPPLAAEIISCIANWLEDEAVMQSFNRYNKNASYEDGIEIEFEGEVVEAMQSRSRMLREFITLAESKLNK